MTTDPRRPRGKQSPPSVGVTRRALARLCEPVADAGRRQGFAGLCVSRSFEQRLAGVLYSSDPLGRWLDDMQQVIGEGPGVTALALRSPVLVPSLDDAGSSARWPLFRREADLLGAAALFCFPVQVGAVDLGLMTVRGARPLRLDLEMLGSFVGLAEALAPAFVASADGGPAPRGRDGTVEPAAEGVTVESGPEPALDLLDTGSLVTHQAVGMVSVQLECSLEEALVALRSRAYAEGRSLGEMAREVVARRSRLMPERPSGGRADGVPEVGRDAREDDDGDDAVTGDVDG